MRRAGRCLSALVPVAAWLGVIALGSSDVGSHSHVTHWVVDWLAQWFPFLHTDRTAHYRVSCALWDLRKPAHLLEYAVLALLAYRALRMLTGMPERGRVLGRWPAARWWGRRMRSTRLSTPAARPCRPMR